MSRNRMDQGEAELFYRAVLSLSSVEECERFFDDVATIGEVQSMAQRMQVARLLDQGRKYAEVEELTGASPATISRVSRCLSYGADGYKLVLNRLKEE